VYHLVYCSYVNIRCALDKAIVITLLPLVPALGLIPGLVESSPVMLVIATLALTPVLCIVHELVHLAVLRVLGYRGRLRLMKTTILVVVEEHVLTGRAVVITALAPQIITGACIAAGVVLNCSLLLFVALCHVLASAGDFYVAYRAARCSYVARAGGLTYMFCTEE